ncbi:MAG: hypothetical protein WKF86_01645 [Acidimicrobiales bacterium]
MPDPVAGDHLAGGYFVARLPPGSPPWMPERLGVTRTISASPELVHMFPTPSWANDFQALASDFGLDPDERAAVGQSADDLLAAGAFGWPNVFFDLEDAQAFRDRYASRRDEIVVIGIGLRYEHAKQFLEDIAVVNVDTGVAAVGRAGVTELLERRVPLADRGRTLGYELLGMDVPPLTSWAVNALPLLVHDRLTISVNENGLIDSFQDAARAAEFISSPDVPSEPFNWTPWLIVEYP